MPASEPTPHPGGTFQPKQAESPSPPKPGDVANPGALLRRSRQETEAAQAAKAAEIAAWKDRGKTLRRSRNQTERAERYAEHEQRLRKTAALRARRAERR